MSDTQTETSAKQLTRSTSLVSGMTLLSRILGFVRDVVVARYFGANLATDAFFVAFKIPNFFRRLFAEGAFNQAFVPVVSEYKGKYSHAEVTRFLSSVTGGLCLTLTLLTFVVIVAAPIVIALFAPGFIGEGEQFDLASSMLRITFPYLLFISLTSLAAGVLNSYGIFGPPAFTPVLLNVVMILTTLYWAPHFETPVMALAWGVFFGGIAQLIFQWSFLKKLKLLSWPTIDWQHPGVKKVLRLIVPAIVGVSAVQIGLLIDTLIASFLQHGSIAWLYYSDRLMEFPLGIFGIALATVILPQLSRHHIENSSAAFSNTLDWALRCVLLIGLPATLGLAFLAKPILITLFQYGAFEQSDVNMAALSLVAYAIGLLGFILVKVLAPAFYARQNTKTPVKIALIALLSNVVLNLILVFPLAHAGLALATSLAAYVNAILLFLALRRLGDLKLQAGWGALWLRLLCANLCMIMVILLLTPAETIWFESSWWDRSIELAKIIFLAAMAYFASAFILGLRLSHFRYPTRRLQTLPE